MKVNIFIHMNMFLAFFSMIFPQEFALKIVKWMKKVFLEIKIKKLCKTSFYASWVSYSYSGKVCWFLLISWIFQIQLIGPVSCRALENYAIILKYEFSWCYFNFRNPYSFYNKVE